MHHHWWEKGLLRQGPAETCALPYRDRYRGAGFAEHQIRHHSTGNVQSMDQGHARGHENTKRRGEACAVQRNQYPAKTGNAKQKLVPALASTGMLQQASRQHNACDHQHQALQRISAHKVADPDQPHRQWRQRLLECAKIPTSSGTTKIMSAETTATATAISTNG